MFRAMILYLLGATFEVRLVKLATGKNIPGQCLYRGGYFGARKAYNKAAEKHYKDAVELRLQSISLLSVHANQVTLGTLPYNSGPATPMSNKWLAEKNQEREAEERKIQVAAGMTDTGELIEREVKIDPYEESMQRSSDNLRQARDEGITDGPDIHECDRDGPWEFEEATGGYTATCSVCGELMPEESENV